MSNPYFSAYSSLSPFQLARSGALDTILDAIIAGFDLLPTPLSLAQDNGNYAVDSGAVNAYAVTLSALIVSYTAGLSLTMKVGTGNSGASTINVNALGVKSIKRFDGNPVQTGDLPTGGVVELVYDGTNFRLISPNGSDVIVAAAAAAAALVSQNAAAASAAAAAASASAASGSAGTASASAIAAAAAAASITGFFTFTTNATFTGKMLGPAGTAALPTYSFSGDSDTGIFSASSNGLGVSCGGAVVGTFSSDGLIMGQTTYSAGETAVGTAGGNVTLQATANYLSRLIMLNWNGGSGFALVRVDATGATTIIHSNNSAGGDNSFDTTNSVASNGGVGIAFFIAAGSAIVQKKNTYTGGVISIHRIGG